LISTALIHFPVEQKTINCSNYVAIEFGSSISTYLTILMSNWQ